MEVGEGRDFTPEDLDHRVTVGRLAGGRDSGISEISPYRGLWMIALSWVFRWCSEPEDGANRDSLGTGHKGRFYMGRKEFYRVKSLVKWMQNNVTYGGNNDCFND